jgi:hypothetical protein
MADPENTGTQAQGTETAQGETPAAESAATPQYVTAEQLQTTLKSATDSMFANMRRLVEGMSKQQGTKAKAKSAEPEEATQHAPLDVETVVDRVNRVNDAMSEYGFSPKQRETVRKLLKMESPEDIGAFVADQAEVFGVKRTAQESTVNPTKKSAETATGRPVSDGGAAVSAPAWDQPGTNPLKWTEDDLARITAAKGGRRQMQRFVRQQAEQYMRGRRLVGFDENKR